MKEGLLNEIAAHGDRGAIVPVSRYDELKRELEALKEGEYHAFSDWIAGRMVMNNELGFQPRSLISVITPSPKVIFEFTYHGKPIHCMVPPQYLEEGTKDQEVLQYINAYLEPLGYKAALFDNLPQKLLAVHCGLGLYGRNNICFNEEFGSYMRIISFVSDAPCDEAAWFPARRMDSCEKCTACITACPTNAIFPSHRVINASICLTALNEMAGEFPEWVAKDAHNSLIGCMKCQDCCPGNAMNKDHVIKGVAFTEEETAELLMHEADEPFSDSLDEKLKASGFSEWILKMLPRNLAALLHV
jgi:epoxyqueuosine reductase